MLCLPKGSCPMNEISRRRILLFIFFLAGYGFFVLPQAHALSPEEIMVLANANAAKSKGLAKYYMEKRQIPEDNLVLVFMTDKESCTREEYEKKAIPPIRRALDKNPKIRAIVSIFGIPLKILAPEKTPGEASGLSRLEDRKKNLEDFLKNNQDLDPAVKEQKNKELAEINKDLKSHKQSFDKMAAFDSELTLVKKDGYDLNMWQPNPYYLGFRKQMLPASQAEVMMTSRLDGPSEEIVKRIIDDSIEAEKTGLKGKAVFDARWKYPKDENVTGYAFYDRSIHRAAQVFQKNGLMEVVLDDSEDLFKASPNIETALYCGWYSLARYVDVFAWQKGSVGYHIASSECTTLREPSSQVWCKKMLEKGIAATIGPVGEPYVNAFPVPEAFFELLADGYLTLAESYLISLPYLSWKMALIGDPLYRVRLSP